MQICRTVSDIRAAIKNYRMSGEDLGLVTTMGALHAGHMSLVSAAKSRHRRIVATIFVNPTQFGDPKDLETYPRDDEKDLALLRDAGVDAVFLPEVSEMYPEGDETIVETTRLANILHGKVRPGHFRGVCTVVSKLFNICQPDAAYFGKKDYQQLQVIRRMVRDLHMPIDIRGVPTMREPDGLAMSSRNVRLTPEDRSAAVCLSKALDAVQEQAGFRTPVDQIDQILRTTINREPRARLRAVDIVEPDTLEPATGTFKGPLAIMLSAEFGGILLIDQREITP